MERMTDERTPDVEIVDGPAPRESKVELVRGNRG
jgi:hypothetical protein